MGLENIVSHLLVIADNLCDSTPICDGNLGMSRARMPQISDEHMSAFLEQLKADGVKIQKTSMRADKLKAVQDEINSSARSISDGNTHKPILISRENYILDGHHRWAHIRLENPSASMPVVKIDMPIRQLLKYANDFKFVLHKDMDEKMVAELITIASDILDL